MVLKEITFPWTRIGCFRRIDPFAVVFCYPLKGESFVMKGGLNTIEKELIKIRKPIFAHVTIWRDGKNRYSRWEFFGLPRDNRLHVNTLHLHEYSWKYPTGFEIITFNPKKIVIEKYRKMPKAFPKAVIEYLNL